MPRRSSVHRARGSVRPGAQRDHARDVRLVMGRPTRRRPANAPARSRSARSSRMTWDPRCPRPPWQGAGRTGSAVPASLPRGPRRARPIMDGWGSCPRRLATGRTPRSHRGLLTQKTSVSHLQFTVSTYPLRAEKRAEPADPWDRPFAARIRKSIGAGPRQRSIATRSHPTGAPRARSFLRRPPAHDRHEPAARHRSRSERARPR